MDLSEVRVKINELDAQIIPLIVERMKIAFEVAEVKRAQGLPVLDRVREQAVLDKAADIAGEEFADAMRAIYEELMHQSRNYQHRLLGEEEEK